MQVRVKFVDHEYGSLAKSVKEWTCERQKLTSSIRLLRSKIELDKSSGDPTVDNAVENQVLLHLQLYPPPPNTPMPVIMSLTGEQPLQ